ncbi:MAG: UpxY family transcription antiterminator [Terracidiphilus sp.]
MPSEGTVELAAGTHASETGAYSGQPLEPRKWFALSTRSHHEKRIVQHLTQRGIQSFLPLYKTVHRWANDRKAELELPLFPGYLFVHIVPCERIRTIEVPGVLSMVHQGKTSTPLEDPEIEYLRSAVQSRQCEPHPYITAGARARIVVGPLAGMEGIVLRRKGGLRVVLSVQLIQQCVAVEVSWDELEAGGACTPGQQPVGSEYGWQ